VALDAKGVAGGIVILCNPTTIILENLFSTERILTTQFKPIGSDYTCFITNVYGPKQLTEKYAFLQSL
jgi:hypothetical protein